MGASTESFNRLGSNPHRFQAKNTFSLFSYFSDKIILVGVITKPESHSVTTETEPDSYDDSRLIALESESSQNRDQLAGLISHLEKVESHVAEIDREKSSELERLRCNLETTNKDLNDSRDKRITTESELNLARRQIDKLAEQVKTLQREKEELEQKCKSYEKEQIVQVHRETSTTLSPQPVTGNNLIFNLCGCTDVLRHSDFKLWCLLYWFRRIIVLFFS